MAELKNKAVNLEVLKEAYKDLDTKKANKTDISVPYKFRGNCTFASLPTSGNEINDTFYVTDEKCKYSWNGTNWYQSSLNETDYLDEFNTFKGEVNNEVSELKGDLSNLEQDFYYDNSVSLDNYVDGKWTSVDKVILTEATFRYYIVALPSWAKSISITNVMCGGNAAIWLKKNGSITSIINYSSNTSYDVTVDINGEDEIWFTTRKNVLPTATLKKESKYATTDFVIAEVSDKLTEDNIASGALSVSIPDTNVGFTNRDSIPSISSDNDCRYSDWLAVKGGETVSITNVLMTSSTAVHIMDNLGNITIYTQQQTGSYLTVQIVLPINTTHIRYSVLRSKRSNSEVSYLTDYKEFRDDFIPSMYAGGVARRNDYPIVTFVDDDGRSDYILDGNLKSIFDSYGVKGTLAVVPNEIGASSDFLTLEQLQTLKSEGYDIVSHSYSHNPAIFQPSQNDGVTEEQIYNDLLQARQWLDNNGFNSECLIFPYGYYRSKKSMFIHQAIKAGFQFACDSGNGSNNLPILDTYWLQRKFVYNTNTLASYKSLIDDCIASNGWLILSTHCFEQTEMGDFSILKGILDYLVEKNVTIKNFRDASAIKKNICSIGYLGDKSNRLYIGRDGKIYI